MDMLGHNFLPACHDMSTAQHLTVNENKQILYVGL